VPTRLRQKCGKSTVPEINEAAVEAGSVVQFESEVKRRFEGSSGFMIFAEIEHTRWIKTYSLEPRVSRIILGNPLYAITMLREDITAGLFVAVELLVIGMPEVTTVLYVKPSSLIAIGDGNKLKIAAEDLDAKLAALVSNITAHDGSGRTQ
jgi:uncharacterized protein (DUF302 family)